MSTNTPYIGRFAPSPSGPLHLGSLSTAVASYLDARAHGGRWLLRMEDLDPPREQTGAADWIIRSLTLHGLHWDGDILWQSQRHAAYQNALALLLQQGHAFYCSCSRRQLAAQKGIHRGTCIAPLDTADAAIRLRAPDRVEGFDDRLLGSQSQSPGDSGDQVLRRRDGLYAYQLAVVVDDGFQHINHVVRGIDLLDTTANQIHLHGLLQQTPPDFLHLPVLTNSAGDKLSKQTGAPAIPDEQPEHNLRRVLAYLGQLPTPTGLDCSGILRHATSQWDLRRIPQQAKIQV